MRKSRPDRIVTTIPCLGFKDFVVIVPNNNVANLGIALQRRVFQEKDGAGGFRMIKPPQKGNFEKLLSDFRTAVLNVLPPMRRASYDEVINTYKGGKKSRYMVAKLKLRQGMVSKRHARLKSFVKVEKLSKVGDPRIISPRSFEYTLELATYLKLNEKKFIKAINDVFGEITVMKGLNILQRGKAIHRKWIQMEQLGVVCFVGFDFSRFDAHVGEEGLSFEHTFYIPVFNDDNLNRLLNFQLKTMGVGIATDGSIHFEKDGQRCSGDINTSLGNIILAAAMLWVWIKKTGITCKAINDGDDNGVFLLEKDLGKFLYGLEDFFLSLGFPVEIEEPVFDVEKVVFCQSSPIWTPSGYTMIRNPKTAINKDITTTMSCQTKNEIMSWLGAVGMCGMILNLNVPVQYNLARKMLSSGTIPKKQEYYDRVNEWGNIERSKGLQRKWSDPHSVHPLTRLSYFKAFGIRPAEQIALEEYYDTLDLDLWSVSRSVNAQFADRALSWNFTN